MSIVVTNVKKSLVSYFSIPKKSKRQDVYFVIAVTLRNYYLFFVSIKPKNLGYQISIPQSFKETIFIGIRETLDSGPKKG
jgi:hypothetical protein